MNRRLPSTARSLTNGMLCPPIFPRWPARSLVLKEVLPTRRTTVTLLGSELKPRWRTRGRDMVIDMRKRLDTESSRSYAYALRITHTGEPA
jgi:hypothetical protein